MNRAPTMGLPGRRVTALVALVAGAWVAALSPVANRWRRSLSSLELPGTELSVAGSTRPVAVTDEVYRGLGTAFRGGATIVGDTPHRLMLFTFDDGPDRSTTPSLLDRLDARGVKAVFFLSGYRMLGRNAMERAQQQLAREIVRRGHVVASHGLEHKQLPQLDNKGVLHELLATEQVFREVFGARPWLFRPPGGAISDRVQQLVAGRGYTTVLWNLGSGDFQVRSAKDVLETWQKVFLRRRTENGSEGGIVLLHDTHAWSVEAFELIYADIMQRNCKLMRRGEELFDVVDDPALFLTYAGHAPGAQGMRLPADILASRQARVAHKTTQFCQK